MKKIVKSSALKIKMQLSFSLKNIKNVQSATLFMVYFLISYAIFYEVDSKVLSKAEETSVNHRPQYQQLSNNKFSDFYEYYEESSFEDLLKQNIVDDDYYAPGEIRFITEDDVEESYHDAEDFLHHQRQISINLENLDSRCPAFGQVHYSQSNLCGAKACNVDEDCANHQDTSLICCFNGCLNTCLRRLDPPKVFDWLGETKIKVVDTNITGESPNLHPKSFQLENEDDSKNIILPGGCSISRQQLDDLRLFRKYDHVETCTCVKGEVVCHVSHVNPNTAYNPPKYFA